MLSIESPSMIRRLAPRPLNPDGAADMDGDAAYAYCADITRQCSKSFYFSTSFLPVEKRRAIRAVYAFCRMTDDLVDSPGTTALRDVHDWRLAARMPAGAQRHPVLYAWADARDRYRVPQKYAEELIDGCEMDLTIDRYETFEALRAYCYRVASTVGLISMHIIGVDGDDQRLYESSIPDAVELGIALQLTNILRDVGEDLSRGRIYLPQEDLRRFGCADEDLRAGIVDDRFRALIQFEIDRAHQLYEAGWPGIANLKRDGRLAVGAAIALYRGILDRIVANDYDVFHKRAHLTTAQKMQRLPGIYWRVRHLQRYATMLTSRPRT